MSLTNLDSSKKLPVVIGITGASGAVYGINLIKFFLDNDTRIELIISDNAVKVFKLELKLALSASSPQENKKTLLNYLNIDESKSALLDIWHQDNVAACVSSGSYKTQGMIIAPASMGTIANIANGTSNNLIARAADVILKERRKLVLLAREAPFNTIHLRNMLSLSEMGAIIVPASPGFYHQPLTLQDQIDFVIGKTLDVFGVENELFKRWQGARSEKLNNPIMSS
jgi:4-hydroxy-3-polyprenylbenzoate decarboxylase